jgi:hypothetical protein
MSADKLEEIDIGGGDKPRPTFISANLDSSFRKELIKLLKEYKDCFAWDYSEMPDLDRSIVEHRLPIKPGFKPYKQPPRKIYTGKLGPLRSMIFRGRADASLAASAPTPSQLACNATGTVTSPTACISTSRWCVLLGRRHRGLAALHGGHHPGLDHRQGVICLEDTGGGVVISTASTVKVGPLPTFSADDATGGRGATRGDVGRVTG